MHEIVYNEAPFSAAMRYGFGPTHAKNIFFYAAYRGKSLCFLGFVQESGKDVTGWSQKGFHRDDAHVQNLMKSPPQRILLTGTLFQCQVWQALQKIPYQVRTTYAQVAESIGRPSSTRAVANAIGANPVSLLIPCHRVIPKAGGIGGYRWGSPIKKFILDTEDRGINILK